MEPLAVLSLVETCAGLAVTAGKLAVGLRTLAANYKLAALTFRSLSSQCKLFACSARAIQQWMEDGANLEQLDASTQEQLMDSLECANDVICALQAELVNTSDGTINTFWEKVNVIWNQPTLRFLEDSIHKQTTGMAIILNIMNLPTSQAQKRELSEKSVIFQDSRTSALSIRHPDASTLHAETTSTARASMAITSSSQLPSFAFDDILMSSRVYLRNRNQTLALNSPPKLGRVALSRETRDFGDDLEKRAEWFELLESQSRESLLGILKDAHSTDVYNLIHRSRNVERQHFRQNAQIGELSERNENLQKVVQKLGAEIQWHQDRAEALFDEENLHLLDGKPRK